ncbi:MAG: DUF883 family protein [Planctomycetota bacterium]|nr:MAG: DUF883 family protein [Planctomycetota bacterium]REJ86619.1 MAG: DUF883 family protein [Planctomycetota bacterium]REK28462.1 MAG: DUF883 family protein [Planctomycetota bacterium]REK29119.1 MAG: DUF883 family protein [Planctomycetota bacterium]
MITRQELEGQWNQVKGRIQERWGEVTEDELQQARGDTNQLVGVLQQRTGETRREIEDFLEEAVAESGGTMEQMTESARHYAEQASAAMQQQYDAMAANVRDGYMQAENAVRKNPIESVAVAFGAGIITGVVVGLALKSR